MPVGHHGGMSPHPAWVKIAILEFLEARLKDAADHPDVGIGHENVQIMDPFTTEYDFYLFVNASWPKYLKLYAKYYDENWAGGTRQGALPDLGKKYSLKYPSHLRLKIEEKIGKAIYDIVTEEDQEIFNASTSKTEIYYTIEQMIDILELEEPDIP